jgi:hypothetical protein
MAVVFCQEFEGTFLKTTIILFFITISQNTRKQQVLENTKQKTVIKHTLNLFRNLQEYNTFMLIVTGVEKFLHHHPN